MRNITKKLQKMRQEKVTTKHESETLRNLNKIQIPEVPDKKKKKNPQINSSNRRRKGRSRTNDITRYRNASRN